MAAGTRNDLNDIIQFGREAVNRIRALQTQTQQRANAGRGRGGRGGGPLRNTARQRALEDQDSISRSFTDALASLRAQSSGVRGGGATRIVPTPPSFDGNGRGADDGVYSTGATSLTPRPSPRAPGEGIRAPGARVAPADTAIPWYEQARANTGQSRAEYVEAQEASAQQARDTQLAQAERQQAPVNAWLESQGFGAEHPIALGQYEGGNYAGFRTQGLMTAAVRGRGGALQADAANTADEARRLAGELEHDAGYQSRLQTGGLYDDVQASMGSAPQMLGVSDINRLGAAATGYEDELAAWRAAEQERVDSARGFADQIGDNPETAAVEGVPLHQWAQLAAMRDYGIDPNIAAGLYGPAMDATAAKAERDSQYLQQYGAPYSEVQSAQTAAAREQEQYAAEMTQAQQDEYEAEQNNYIFQTTGINGADLAQSLDITPDQLVYYLDLPAYSDYKQQIIDAGADPDDFDGTLAEIAMELQLGTPDKPGDPMLWRILQTEFDLPDP